MIDLSAIQSVSRVMERVSQIETQLGLRRSAQAVKPEPAKTDKLQAVNKQGFEELFQKELKNSAPGKNYNAAIRTAAAKYGVDPRLVSAVAEAESGFNQESVSHAGAVGVMQLMPDTAAQMGVNPYDAEQNIDGGTRYLSQMLETFGGDVRKAVAAYNAGPQAVKKYGGVPPYSETQAYVNTVLDLYR